MSSAPMERVHCPSAGVILFGSTLQGLHWGCWRGHSGECFPACPWVWWPTWQSPTYPLPISTFWRTSSVLGHHSEQVSFLLLDCPDNALHPPLAAEGPLKKTGGKSAFLTWMIWKEMSFPESDTAPSAPGKVRGSELPSTAQYGNL